MPVLCGWRWAVLLFLLYGIGEGGRAANDLIILDPVCRPGEPRNKPLPPGNPAPSTRKMAELLRKISEEANPHTMAYLADRVTGALTNARPSATNFSKRANLEFNIGLSQINSGRPDLALNTFHALESAFGSRRVTLDDSTEMYIRMQKAVAYLRLGEQENCIANQNADSCLFPFRPNAFHMLSRGSRGALKLLNEQLAKHPEDLTAMWLLNIAHMTLGEYPDRVPAEFLIDPKVFASDCAMPRFPDVANKLGLNVDDLAGGVIIDDFDNDGYLDLVVSSWDLRGQIRYFRNNGDGTFAQRTSEAGLVGLTSGLNLQQTDYNNDGLLDIFVLRGGWLKKAGRIPNSLIRNNGDGTFTDVTEEAGLLSFHPTQTCEWIDFDGDGWLDVFIGNESNDPNDPDYCELFRNNRNGTFTECAQESGIKIASFIKGIAAGDYDNDGRPDIYISRRDGPNILLRNETPGANGKWFFRDVSAAAGVADRVVGFPTWFFDYDNDGWEDIFCSGYFTPNGIADVASDYLDGKSEAAYPKLYRNNGDGTFSDVTTAAKLHRICITMGCSFGDLDNDGWLDFYLGTGDPDFKMILPNRMFRNAGGKFFQDVTTATGTGHLQKGHGVSFADLDNDGDQDVYVVMGGAYSGDNAKNALFQNPGTTNAWVKLKLTGVKANRAAIGAQVKITLETPGGPRSIYRRVTHGTSFGANPLRLEIGLGDAKKIESVEIKWPGSNTRQTIGPLDLNQTYEIREGILEVAQVKLRRLAF